jgi:hypothetical protein
VKAAIEAAAPITTPSISLPITIGGDRDVSSAEG